MTKTTRCKICDEKITLLEKASYIIDKGLAICSGCAQNIEKTNNYQQWYHSQSPKG